MNKIRVVFKSKGHLIELKDFMTIAGTTEKNIFSVDLRAGMKGRCQNACLDSLIEENKKITQHINLSIFSCIKSYTDVLIKTNKETNKL